MKLDRFIALFSLVTPGIIASPLNIDAQTRIDAWTTDNGLPQNSVTGLTQTPDGYIWFTTNDGLVRFDGVRFKVFNKSNTPEIPTNRMAGVFADKSGKLWIHTEDGGILCYEKGVFSIAMKPGEAPDGFRSPFLNDPNGGVIFDINYKYHGYKQYCYRDGKFVPLNIAGMSENSRLVLTDREGGLWFSGEKRLRRIKDGNITEYDFSEFYAGETYKTAYEDSHGSVWLSYADSDRLG